MNFGIVAVMNTSNLARATFVLSKTVHQDLAYLSARMGRSRSALVREVLEPGISEMAELLRGLPDQPDADQVDLFRDSLVARVDDLASRAREDLGRG